MHNITPVDAFTLPVAVPDNVDSGVNRAGDVENIAQTLANQTRHLNLHSAKVDVANTFTVGQTIDFNSSSAACLVVNSSAHNHPGSSSNRWKLITDLTMSDGIHVREYSGEGDFVDGSAWCRTINASWDPASGAQNWTKDNVSKESSLLRLEYGEMFFYGRQAAAGTWNDNQWDDQQRGNLFVGDTVTAKNLTASAILTGQTLHTTSSAQIDGPLNVNGPIDSGGDIFASDDIIATDEFQYGPPKTRLTLLPLAAAYGNAFKNFQSYLVMTGSDVVTWAIKLPHGAVLNSVDVMYTKTGGSSVQTFTVRKHSISWSGSGTPPTCTQIATTTESGGAGNYVINTSFGGLTISKDEDYEFIVQDGNNNDQIHCVRLHWTDPGPRNH